MSKMKSLKFAPELVPLVLSGQKTATWRLFDDKNLQSDDDIELINKETGVSFGRAKVTSVVEKKLGDVQEYDWEGHERFASEEEMYETYRRYYGNRVGPDTLVRIVRFELL